MKSFYFNPPVSVKDSALRRSIWIPKISTPSIRLSTARKNNISELLHKQSIRLHRQQLFSYSIGFDFKALSALHSCHILLLQAISHINIWYKTGHCLLLTPEFLSGRSFALKHRYPLLPAKGIIHFYFFIANQSA